MNLDDLVAVDTVELEQLRFAAEKYIPGSYRPQVRWDLEGRTLAIEIERHIWARRLGDSTAKWPADWWEAVKERWFPVWAKARWPVRYSQLDTTAWHLYPAFQYEHHTPRLYFDAPRFS